MTKQAWLHSAGVLALWSTVVLAGPAYTMTLEEAAQLAVRTNPQVTAIGNDRLAVDQELRQGRALYYPSVDLTSDIGSEFTSNPTTKQRLRQRDHASAQRCHDYGNAAFV